ncbi:hypothetical protein [Erythrobacter aureus]|uniref:hypothetical protein n=1 Tax=Erythrobacter aureus TaxID=2182384 RepID=UPI003A8D9B80
MKLRDKFVAVADVNPVLAAKSSPASVDFRIGQYNDIAEATERVLLDGVAVGIAGGAWPTEYAREVEERFLASDRVADRADGVPGREIGATQFGKRAAAYACKSAGVQAELDRILGGYNGLYRNQIRTIANRLQLRGYRLRPAIVDGEAITPVRLVNWTDTAQDKYVLRPHDDFAQTRFDPAFEVSEIQLVAALNIYPRSVRTAGQLAVSTWRPDDSDRESRGITETGYPYSDADFEAHPRVIVPLDSGDAVAARTQHVHCVLRGDGNVANRLLVNTFFGIRGKEILMWA